MAEGQRMTAAQGAVEQLMRSDHVDVSRESVALMVRARTRSRGSAAAWTNR